MNFAAIMNGRLTYRVAYTAMLAGIYLIALQVGDILDLPEVMETRRIIGAVLKGEGFYTLLGGLGLYGLRRAIENGILQEPEEKEMTPEEQAARLKEMYEQFVATVEKSKGKS